MSTQTIDTTEGERQAYQRALAAIVDGDFSLWAFVSAEDGHWQVRLKRDGMILHRASGTSLERAIIASAGKIEVVVSEGE